jgi:hypothetical protein
MVSEDLFQAYFKTSMSVQSQINSLEELIESTTERQRKQKIDLKSKSTELVTKEVSNVQTAKLQNLLNSL